MYFPLPKRSLAILWLVFGLVTQLGFFQPSCAQELTHAFQGMIQKEISQYEDPQTLLKAKQQIDNEQNPSKVLKLISPWLQADSKKNLTKEKQPYLWAALHRKTAQAFIKIKDRHPESNIESAIGHLQQALQVYSLQTHPSERLLIQEELKFLHIERFHLGMRKKREDVRKSMNRPVQEALVQSEKNIRDVNEALHDKYVPKLEKELEKIIEDTDDGMEIYEKVKELVVRDLPQDEKGKKHLYLPMYSFDEKTGEFKEANRKNQPTSLQGQFNAAIVANAQKREIAQIKSLTARADQEFGSSPESAVISSLISLQDQQLRPALSSLIDGLKSNDAMLEGTSFTPEGRQRLVEEAGDLFGDAIWLAVQLGDYSQAARLLEWGKARFLRQNLALGTLHLHELQNKVAELEVLLQDPQVKSDSVKVVDLRHELRYKREQLSEALRQNHGSALKDKDLAQWLAALQPGGALIAPIFSNFGTVVFVVPAGTQEIKKSHFLLLPEFSRSNLRIITRGEKEGKRKSDVLAYWDWASETDIHLREKKKSAWQNQLSVKKGEWGGYLQAHWDWASEKNTNVRLERKAAWQNQLTATLDNFRVSVLDPIISRLREFGVHPGARLLWLPDDDIGLLPIHATAINGQPLLAQYDVQFAPSLYSFYTAYQRLKNNSRNEHLLAVINPTENLNYSSIEGELVARFFATKTTLMGSEASSTNLDRALRVNLPTYLHLSTHGSFRRLDPLNSGLELAKKDRLTIGNLLSKSGVLNGSRIAVLSACETGVTSISAPAEAMGLPAAFMQAGAPGVISTLWTVNDRSTTFLLNKFYELHRNQNMSPPKALAQAQNWLRTATYKDLYDSMFEYLNKWLKLNIGEVQSLQFTSMARMLKWLSENAEQRANEKPYQEPYFWAGFIYSGV